MSVCLLSVLVLWFSSLSRAAHPDTAFAYLSEASYAAADIPSILSQVPGATLLETQTDVATGIVSRVFRLGDGRIVMGIGGTEFATPMTFVTDTLIATQYLDPENWLMLQGLSMRMNTRYLDVLKEYGRVDVVTGHSLGGFLGRDLVERYNGLVGKFYNSPFYSSCERVTHYVMSGDIISNPFVLFGGKKSGSFSAVWSFGSTAMENNQVASLTSNPLVSSVADLAGKLLNAWNIYQTASTIIQGTWRERARLLLAFVVPQPFAMYKTITTVGQLVLNSKMFRHQTKGTVFGRPVIIEEKYYPKAFHSDQRKCKITDAATGIWVDAHERNFEDARKMARHYFLELGLHQGWTNAFVVRSGRYFASKGPGGWARTPDACPLNHPYDFVNMITLALLASQNNLVTGYDLSWIGWYGVSHTVLSGRLSYSKSPTFHFEYTAPAGASDIEQLTEWWSKHGHLAVGDPQAMITDTSELKMVINEGRRREMSDLGRYVEQRNLTFMANGNSASSITLPDSQLRNDPLTLINLITLTSWKSHGSYHELQEFNITEVNCTVWLDRCISSVNDSISIGIESGRLILEWNEDYPFQPVDLTELDLDFAIWFSMEGFVALDPEELIVETTYAEQSIEVDDFNLALDEEEADLLFGVDLDESSHLVKGIIAVSVILPIFLGLVCVMLVVVVVVAGCWIHRLKKSISKKDSQELPERL